MLTHVWVGRKNHPDRRGQLCRILVAVKGKFIIEFADGTKTVTVRGTFKKRTIYVAGKHV